MLPRLHLPLLRLRLLSSSCRGRVVDRILLLIFLPVIRGEIILRILRLRRLRILTMILWLIINILIMLGIIGGIRSI